MTAEEALAEAEKILAPENGSLDPRDGMAEKKAAIASAYSLYALAHIHLEKNRLEHPAMPKSLW